MAQALTAGMAPGIVVSGGYVIRLDAIDPATGAAVSGVKVSGVVITGANLAAAGDDGTTATAEPLWLDLPNTLNGS